MAFDHIFVYCMTHQTTEDAKGGYTTCFECKHVYRTRRELREQHRKLRKELVFNRPAMRWWEGLFSKRIEGWEHYRGDIWQWLISPMRRTSRIRSCPWCGHDF